MGEKTKGRGRTAMAASAIAVIAIVAVALLRIGCPRGPGDDRTDPADRGIWAQDLPLTRVVLLFFPKPYGGGFQTEARRLVVQEGTVGLMKSALLELTKGPKESSLLPPFKYEVGVQGVYWSSDGTLYVDFEAGVEAAVGSGVSEEIAAIQAVAGTIFFNFPQVNRIKVLVDGEPVRSLSGHVDLSRFLYPEDWLESAEVEF